MLNFTFVYRIIVFRFFKKNFIPLLCVWWKFVFAYFEHENIFDKKLIQDLVITNNYEPNRRLNLLTLNLFDNEILDLPRSIFLIIICFAFLKIFILFFKTFFCSSKFKIDHLLKYLIWLFIASFSINNFWFQSINNLGFENILFIAKFHVYCFLLDFNGQNFVDLPDLHWVQIL